MQDFIDIYSKLVIAIISFIAPLIVYLLSVFGDGLNMLKEIAEEKEEQVTKLLLNDLTNGDKNGNGKSELIGKSNNELKKLKSSNARRANLLKPKRQINRIFYSLFGALLLTMLTVIIKGHDIYIHKIHLAHIFLVFSIILFACGMIIIRQVAWVIIETKQQLEALKKVTEKKENEIKPVEILNNHEG